MNPIGEHLDEITGLLFLEGQLDPVQSARVSHHVASCTSCGALLRVLESESQWLGQALLEETEALPARLLAAPVEARHLSALWAWALSFCMAGVAIYAVWTVILGPWLDQLDLMGMGSTNLLATIFFSGAFWEGWESMLDTLQYTMLLAIAIGVLLLLRHHWRRWTAAAGIVAGLALLLGMPGSANGAEIRRGSSVDVAEGETLHNDLIAAASSMRIDGTVDGDLIAFGENVTVNGHVTGDVIAFSENVRIAGPVDGNVRCFCGSLTLEGPVGKNASIFAKDAEIDPKASLGGGIIAFVSNIVLDGKVTRDLLFFAANTSLNGTVGGNIFLRGGSLIIGPSAQVAGNVHVIGNSKPEVSSGARLGSPVQFNFRPRRNGYRNGGVVIRAILRYGAAFLFGLLLITVLPGLFGAGMRATRQTGPAMGVGAIVLICGFALALLSVLLAFAGVATGIATVFLYVPLIYGAQVFVGTWIGEKLRGQATAPRALMGRLALGLLLLHLVEMIPLLGGLIWLVAAIWGTGALCMALWECLRPQAALVSPAISA